MEETDKMADGGSTLDSRSGEGRGGERNDGDNLGLGSWGLGVLGSWPLGGAVVRWCTYRVVVWWCGGVVGRGS